MSTITIDGTDYAFDSLSTEAQSELTSMQACDQRLDELQTDWAIATTARNAYANALKGLLPPIAKAKPKVKPKPTAKAKKV